MMYSKHKSIDMTPHATRKPSETGWKVLMGVVTFIFVFHILIPALSHGTIQSIFVGWWCGVRFGPVARMRPAFFLFELGKYGA